MKNCIVLCYRVSKTVLPKCSIVYQIIIHSFIQAISIAPLKSTTTQKRSRHSTDTVPEFHAEVPLATASSGLAQDPYVAVRAGFEPTTLRSNGIDSTNAPLCPTALAELVEL